VQVEAQTARRAIFEVAEVARAREANQAAGQDVARDDRARIAGRGVVRILLFSLPRLILRITDRLGSVAFRILAANGDMR